MCIVMPCVVASALVRIVGGRERTAKSIVYIRFVIGRVFCLALRLVWRGGLWVGEEGEEELCDGSMGSVVTGVRRVG